VVDRSEPEEDGLDASIRRLRPEGPSGGSIERRLAIASILGASGSAKALPRLGRLEVQSRLGGGGMGVVYRAYDPNLGRLVAVKLLRSWMPRERRGVIAAEARALAQLNHPNVVTVHEIVEGEDELYFVMEYVPGRTLRAWLDAHPSASWRDVAEWFAQAGRGLVAAHDRGLVHGDFKPENVLVGDDGRVRVVDFGLSRPLHADAGGHETGGTPHYMAPELGTGAPPSPRSDQYAFCRALGDALATRSPPAALTDSLSRGLLADPEDRHHHLNELLAVLQGVLEATKERSRAVLLARVDRLWLQGVLDRSLGEIGALTIALSNAPELVRPRASGMPTTWELGSERSFGSHEVAQLLEAAHGSLLLVGGPGAGKTTLLLQLGRELWRTATWSADAPAPVVLSLSTYAPPPASRASTSAALGDHFAAWVVDELVAKYGLPRRASKTWLEEASVALLLDGLDETDPTQRDRVIEAIDGFRATHPAPLVVTSRDSEYEAATKRLSFGAALRLEPLDDANVTSLVESKRASRLMAQLARDPELREELRNPLLLTLYASSEDSSEGDAEVEDPSWARAYQRYVERAFAGVSNEERHQLGAQLGFLAQTMRRLSVSDLWLEQLTFAWLERPWERRVGYALGVLAVLLFGVGLNLAQVPLTGDPLPSALTFGIGVSLSSFAFTRGRIKPVERLRWSWRRMLRLLPVTTVCATLVGLAEALRVNFAANITGAAITGAILAVTFALESGDRATRVRPNAGVRRSLAYALGVSLGFGIPVGLAFAFVINPYVTRPLIEVVEHQGNPSLVIGVAVGLFVFTALFLIYGGFTVLMHGVLRLWLAWRTPLPFDLQRALDRAVELRLMRRVGGGYLFLHRTLLDHFADAR